MKGMHPDKREFRSLIDPRAVEIPGGSRNYTSDEEAHHDGDGFHQRGTKFLDEDDGDKDGKAEAQEFS
jgi:hypothetical protein